MRHPRLAVDGLDQFATDAIGEILMDRPQRLHPDRALLGREAVKLGEARSFHRFQRLLVLFLRDGIRVVRRLDDRTAQGLPRSDGSDSQNLRFTITA